MQENAPTSMKKKTTTSKAVYSSFLIKKEGKLKFKLNAHKVLFDKFIEQLPENTDVEIFYNVQSDIASLPAIARVHVMLRELAKEIGVSEEDIKTQAKRKSGFCNKDGCKSIGDMETSEIATLSETIIEMGDFVGLNLR